MNEPREGRLQNIRCPRCGIRAQWKGNPNRPFCSERCRLIDLGQWADESYRVPGGNLSEELQGSDEIPVDDENNVH